MLIRRCRSLGRPLHLAPEILDLAVLFPRGSWRNATYRELILVCGGVTVGAGRSAGMIPGL